MSINLTNWVFDLYRTMPHSNAQEQLDDNSIQLKISIYVASLRKHKFPAEFFTDQTLVAISEKFRFFPELKDLLEFLAPQLKDYREKQEAQRQTKALACSTDLDRNKLSKAALSLLEHWESSREDQDWSDIIALEQMSWRIRSKPELRPFFKDLAANMDVPNHRRKALA